MTLGWRAWLTIILIALFLLIILWNAESPGGGTASPGGA